ncbi:MAG: carbohydrate ABC transporter permease [Planctomycetota bacterium]|jgi:multiple sugar transport system permease protein
MSIMLAPERRSLGGRVILGAIYALLALGGASMVYPFLLMVSGSTKSRIDAYDFDVVPRFFHDEALLFRKFEAAKYNEDLQTYVLTTGEEAGHFRDVTVPAKPTAALVRDWEDFLARPMPDSWYQLGFSAVHGDRDLVVQGNERGFKRFMEARCGGDPEVFRRDYAPTIQSWFYLRMRSERLLDRNFQVPRDRLWEAFYEFKASRPPVERVYVSCDGAYRRFVRLSGGGTPGPARNAVLARTVPGGENERRHWEMFVRGRLNPQFVVVDPAARADWARFLERRHADVGRLNKLYGTRHAAFADVPLPADRVHASPALTDFLLFLRDRELLRPEHISLDTPETRWRAFLQGRYRTVGEAAAAHGKAYGSFDAVPMPQREIDYAHCLANSGSIRRHFVGRNFRMVFEYIWEYGRGIVNTIIYCTLAVALALLVNPLAAYALSRYRLPSQYKVLLFLIATMAFPAMVTMIPNFLLLRDLGLLNTFAALLLPGMANGYSIFLLKGFFDSLPKELYEAADIDGANEWQKFWLVTMSLSKPILAVIALGAFTGAYSNFMYAFILCQDSSMWTLMVWLFQLQQFAGQGVVFASVLVAAVPTLLVFVFCQKLIIRGIVVPSMK